MNIKRFKFRFVRKKWFIMFPIQYNNKKEEFYEIIWFHTSLHQKREEAEIATNKTCVIWQLLYVIIDCMQILLLILPFISLTSRVTHMKLMYMKSSDKKSLLFNLSNIVKIFYSLFLFFVFGMFFIGNRRSWRKKNVYS